MGRAVADTGVCDDAVDDGEDVGGEAKTEGISCEGQMSQSDLTAMS